jgi:hypothetical protein
MFSIIFHSITEENFWRNYFYRVALICQAGDLGTLGDDNEFGKRGISEDNEGNCQTTFCPFIDVSLRFTLEYCFYLFFPFTYYLKLFGFHNQLFF